MRHTYKKAALLPLFLAACGGGGAGGSGNAAFPSPPAAIALSGSGGDMSKYIGTWTSGCGYNSSGVNLGKYQKNTFYITTATGPTASGTLVSTLYTDIACATPVGGSLPSSNPITLAYQSNVTVTSGTPASMTGSADQLLLTYSVSLATQAYVAGFASNFTKFYQSPNSHFDNTSLSYAKS